MKDRPTETDAALTAVTPIDGRYRARTRSLEAYFSEFALIRYRVRVEIEWYLSLAGASRDQRAETDSRRDREKAPRRLRGLSRSTMRAA